MDAATDDRIRSLLGTPLYDVLSKQSPRSKPRGTIFTFHPFRQAEVERAVRHFLETVPCRLAHVRTFIYEEAVHALLVRKVMGTKAVLRGDAWNGRRVAEVVKDLLDGEIEEAIRAKHREELPGGSGSSTRAWMQWASRAASELARAASQAVGGQGYTYTVVASKSHTGEVSLRVVA